MLEAAIEAGKKAKWLSDKDKIKSRRKPDGSEVTNADRLAQCMLRTSLRKACPEAYFIGEEGTAGQANLNALSSGTRLFIVDPIDGTRSYKLKKSTWSISIADALIVQDADGRKRLNQLAAAVYAPCKNTLYYAVKGLAFVLNPVAGRINLKDQPGRRLNVATANATDKVPVVTLYRKGINQDQRFPDTKTKLEAIGNLLGRSSKYRMDALDKGSPALSLAMAAERGNNIVITREDDPFQPVTNGMIAPWDTIAGRYIYEQAGGKAPVSADRHGNICLGQGNLSVSIMAPTQEQADEMDKLLTNTILPDVVREH